MNHLDKWGGSPYRPSVIATRKYTSVVDYIYNCRQTNKFDDLTVKQLKTIVDTYYKEIEKELLEGRDFKIPALGIIKIRFQKRKYPSKKIGYYSEMHLEFLTHRLHCYMSKLKFEFIKNVRSISFKPLKKLRNQYVNNVIHKGYKNIYLYDQ